MLVIRSDGITQDLVSQQNALRSQQELLQTHEATLRRITELQKDQEEATATMQSLRNEIQSLQRTIENITKESDETKRSSAKQQDSLKQQLELSKLMLQEKVDEVERLKESKGDECQRTATTTESSHDHRIVAMQADTRRLNLAQTIARFGDNQYFSVQFWIRSPNRSAASFEVQIRTHEMPHTVYTFLNLVDAGLYHETTIVNTNDKIVGGGKPSGKLKSSLLRKYAQYGYGITPLLFTEVSTTDCNDDDSFGIVSRGPEFAIGNSLTSCFGRVIDGQDALSTLKDEKESSSATIIDARILKYKHDDL